MLRNDDGTIACICYEHRTECNCRESVKQCGCDRYEYCPACRPIPLHPITKRKVWWLWVHLAPPPDQSIPNRLFGVEINSQGEAV